MLAQHQHQHRHLQQMCGAQMVVDTDAGTDAGADAPMPAVGTRAVDDSADLATPRPEGGVDNTPASRVSDVSTCIERGSDANQVAYAQQHLSRGRP